VKCKLDLFLGQPIAKLSCLICLVCVRDVTDLT
jgi:hypothetical protein